MYQTLHSIFADKEGGVVFTCFGLWHLLYAVLAVAVMVTLLCCFAQKEQPVKDRLLNILVAVPFGLYMLDFFLMPFAYGEIDVDKLPFHACTAMCVMCFASRHDKHLGKYRLHFALLGLIANLTYVVYPAGVMWYEIHPLSYRAVQTLLFHSAMVIYGVLALLYDSERLQIKRCYRDVVILGALTVWAMLGNALYSGAAGDYDRDFNWFFLKADPLDLFSESIALYIMPWLNIVVFFATEVLIYLLLGLVERHRKPRNV